MNRMVFVCFLLLINNLLAEEKNPILILNMLNQENLPKHFRSIKSLALSGSGQFSKHSLREVLKKIQHKKVVVVDLRQESHAYINDGDAVSWFLPRDWENLGLSDLQVKEKEQSDMLKLRNSKTTVLTRIVEKNQDGTIRQGAKEEVPVLQVFSEQELVNDLGATYHRFYILDHARPSDREVAEMLPKMRNWIQEGFWVHAHCLGGDGRTTTFMVMMDILKNAKDLTLDAILQRQRDWGGRELRSTESDLEEDGTWKFPLAKERIEFLEQFYAFVREGDSAGSWLAFIERKNSVLKKGRI